MSVAQIGLTGKTLCDKYLFQSEIPCMKAWHTMGFRENNSGNKRACKSELVSSINQFEYLSLFFMMQTQPYRQYLSMFFMM